jgi:hypothetical protein
MKLSAGRHEPFSAPSVQGPEPTALLNQKNAVSPKTDLLRPEYYRARLLAPEYFFYHQLQIQRITEVVHCQTEDQFYPGSV